MHGEQDLTPCPVYDGSVAKDPYWVGNVFVRVAKFMGYPVRLEQIEVENEDKQNSLLVFTDSEVTSTKLSTINYLFSDYIMSIVLHNIAPGIHRPIKQLIEGDHEGFYDFYYYVKFRQPPPTQVLERAYRSAYERILDRDRRNKPFNRDFFLPTAAETEFYQGLIDKGVPALNPEGMGILLIRIIEDIQQHHPHLKP